MQLTNLSVIQIENTSIESKFLQRKVFIDFYLPSPVIDNSFVTLLLINDGQNMKELGLQKILGDLSGEGKIKPVFCVGIHAGVERKMEYGVASATDYIGRGAKAGLYASFVMKELLPSLQKSYPNFSFSEKAFAGFSLGGLSAMDIAWNHPKEFSTVGVFSGSFWWRSLDQTHKEYDDDKHRIMQQQIRNGEFKPELKFFFQCGNKDEIKDRNQNGIIDSIDDTLDIIEELIRKGYDRENDIYYLELKDGRHDIETWGRAMPIFLQWMFS